MTGSPEISTGIVSDKDRPDEVACRPEWRFNQSEVRLGFAPGEFSQCFIERSFC